VIENNVRGFTLGEEEDDDDENGVVASIAS